MVVTNTTKTGTNESSFERRNDSAKKSLSEKRGKNVMRILMLTQFYPPMIGGETGHVRNLSIELVARGHDVAVVTLWREDLPEFECDQGVRVYRIRGAL